MEEPDTNHKQLITMDITTDHVRRGLMSQFNQTSPQKELTKSLALITNGELSKQSSSGPDTPPRTPPPIPPRSPLCVSVTEIGGLPDEQGEGAQIKLLQEEIAKLKQEAKLKDKTVNKLQRKLQKHDDTNKAKKGIRQWQRTQPSIQDLKRTSVFEEPDDQHELFTHFVESERQYLNHLEVMDAYYYQPLKMMAIFKPEMLSILQLEVLFLNSPQILLNHRIFYDELKHIKTLPKNSRMEEFLLLLERSFPSFTIYQGFLSECRSQLLQKELRACRMKQQLSTLLDHFEQKVGGHSLQQMLLVPTDRISEYVSLLQMLMRCDVSDGVKKRVDGLITFLSNIKADVPDDKNQWECTLEKVTKVLQKLHPDGPIPLDIFDSNTKLVKHGQLAQVIKSKEVQKQCYLFSNYVAMAERSSENSYLLKEDGLRSLAGATIFKRVDMAGQIMQNDLKSGLQQDRLAFRINFPSFDHMVLRVARPNELTKWVEAFEKCIEDSQQLELEEEEVDSFIPDVELKIAAASLSKLFQHLTNTNSEFIDVFLTTYPCFTTPTEVLTALLNCIKEKTPEQNSQVSHCTMSRRNERVYRKEEREGEDLWKRRRRRREKERERAYAGGVRERGRRSMEEEEEREREKRHMVEE